MTFVKNRHYDPDQGGECLKRVALQIDKTIDEFQDVEIEAHRIRKIFNPRYQTAKYHKGYFDDDEGLDVAWIPRHIVLKSHTFKEISEYLKHKEIFDSKASRAKATLPIGNNTNRLLTYKNRDNAKPLLFIENRVFKVKTRAKIKDGKIIFDIPSFRIMSFQTVTEDLLTPYKLKVEETKRIKKLQEEAEKRIKKEIEAQEMRERKARLEREAKLNAKADKALKRLIEREKRDFVPEEGRKYVNEIAPKIKGQIEKINDYISQAIYKKGLEKSGMISRHSIQKIRDKKAHLIQIEMLETIALFRGVELPKMLRDLAEFIESGNLTEDVLPSYNQNLISNVMREALRETKKEMELINEYV